MRTRSRYRRWPPERVDRRLFQPRWLVAHIVVLAVAALFVSLGMWQLRRHDERVGLNAMGERRLSEPAEDIVVLLDSDAPQDLEYRRVTASGEFVPDQQVLIRSRVYRDTAGFHVVTPLLLEDGTAVLVNRGWVPLDYAELPDNQVEPPAGETYVEGWVHLTEEKPSFGPVDPPQGVLAVLNRVDIGRISRQLPMEVAPVYIVETGEQGSELPIPLAVPTFDDQGPHLSYAIQWFGFAVVGLVGYYFLARRRLGMASGGRPPA